MPSASSPVQSFQLRVEEAGRKLAVMDEESSPALEARAAGVVSLGKSRRLIVSLTPGSHRLVIALARSSRERIVMRVTVRLEVWRGRRAA